MMSFWNLLYVVPISFFFGFMVAALMKAGRE